MVCLNFQGGGRGGAPNSSIEERDFLDLAPVDEGGEHEGPARERLGWRRWLRKEREREVN